jgi:transposase
LREEYRQAISQLPKSQLVYVDETGIDQYLYRPYARAPRGLPAQGKLSGRRYERTSIVAGQCGRSIVAPLQYEGTMDGALFRYWFGKMLLPSLAPGSVIVLDNARFHQKKILHGLAQKAGCSVLFLPPYSPDLNPIEKFWAWLKARLRKILPRFLSLDDAIHDCFKGG